MVYSKPSLPTAAARGTGSSWGGCTSQWDAQAVYPDQQEEISHPDAPNSEPYTSKGIDLHSFPLQGAQLERKSILMVHIWRSRVTNQRMPMPGALSTPSIAISSRRGEPKPTPHMPTTAGFCRAHLQEILLKQGEPQAPPHASTEHHWFHCSPPLNQQQSHHPPKISLAPPS